MGQAGRENDFLLLPEGETKQEKAESRGCVRKGSREQNEEEGMSRLSTGISIPSLQETQPG